MSPWFAISLFIAITLVLILLPFLPSLKELREKKDANPLRVVSDSEVNIRYFALRFTRFLKTKLGDAMTACVESGKPAEGFLDDGTPYLITPNGSSTLLTEPELQVQASQRMILSCGDLRLPAETMFLPEVFAAGSIHGGERCIYRAILAGESIDLAAGSLSLRWVHAGGAVRIAGDSMLYGRVSSDEMIGMDGECAFERLHAPRIVFGSSSQSVVPTGSSGDTPALQELKSDSLPNLVDDSAGRWLYEHDLEIPAESHIRADLVCTGELHIGSGTRIEGSIKSREKLRLDPGVEVTGSVVGGGDLSIGKGCRIGGPVIAEGDVEVESGSVIGTAGSLTTVSAGAISMAGGVIVHGTVWAHTTGRCTVAEAAQAAEHA